MKKIVFAITLAASLMVFATGCGEYEPSGTEQNVIDTRTAVENLTESQPTPTDINYSLERYNLIRRAYWVNGQWEKAASLPCPIEKPLSYIVLLTDTGAVVGRYVVDGKVSSLNSYLSPDSLYYEIATGSSVTYKNEWLADVDGSYGENVDGIFWFTPDGHYYEWPGLYLYTDVPIEVDNPVLHVEG